MCVGIPMRVLDAGSVLAVCEGRGERRQLDLRLVGPQRVGTWVLAFAGAARVVLTASRAAEIDRALDGLEAALSGDPESLDAFFPDLADRKPELPEHLRPAHLRPAISRVDPFGATARASAASTPTPGDATHGPAE